MQLLKRKQDRTETILYAAVGWNCLMKHTNLLPFISGLPDFKSEPNDYYIRQNRIQLPKSIAYGMSQGCPGNNKKLGDHDTSW
jgi:hypothetical protein